MVHKHLPNFYRYVVLPSSSHQSRNLPHILYQTRYATLSTEWEKEFYSAIPVFQRIYVCFSLSLCLSMCPKTLTSLNHLFFSLIIYSCPSLSFFLQTFNVILFCSFGCLVGMGPLELAFNHVLNLS